MPEESWLDQFIKGGTAEKLLSLGIGAGAEYFGLNDPQIQKTGYQGGIPEYEVQRERVPNIYDPNRRPGSAGRRYFTDTQFIPKTAGPALPDAAGLANINAQNVALANAMPGVTAPAPAPAGIAAAAPAVAPAVAPAGIAAAAPQPTPAPISQPKDDLYKVGYYVPTDLTDPYGYLKDTREDQKQNFSSLPSEFFDSPEWESTKGGLMGGRVVTGTKYFGQWPNTAGKDMDAAYEAYLNRTGQTDLIIPDPPFERPVSLRGPYAMDDAPPRNQSPIYNTPSPPLRRTEPTPRPVRGSRYWDSYFERPPQERLMDVPRERISEFYNLGYAGLPFEYEGRKLWGQDYPGATRPAVMPKDDHRYAYGVEGGQYQVPNKAWPRVVEPLAPHGGRARYITPPYAKKEARAVKGNIATPQVPGGSMGNLQRTAQNEGLPFLGGGTDTRFMFANGGIATVPTEGMGRYIGGSTDGMADVVPANIEGTQEARLSDGEFVMPADVVSHLGNGNSKAGAETLYDMMDRIREARTGMETQAKQINPNQFLPV